ncbi:MAG TPA: CHAT domain-containing protein, partial [Pyrinomonadaceae bacterium]|nr:CHAT domain-containing protein [Pyrinomonadaceae bacterium]
GVLQKPATRADEATPQERALREYFGEEKFRELRELADPKRAKETREELGNVVLLPGIMGSHLSVVEANGDEDHIWVSLWRLVKGDMKRLKLSSDGKTNTNGEAVKATGLIGWYYALALETLQAEPFPYDWRVSVCDTADKLAEFVSVKLADGTFDPAKPVHFVAHSMGGLVVRNFVRQHNDLWKQANGRLVMLGTPNSGSFAAIQTLMGKNSLIKNIAAILPFQSKSDWTQVVNSFPGLYQLCPSKLVNPEVYEKPIWEKFPDVAFDGQLLMIPKFHQDLFDTRQTTIDTQRMTYIAGVGFETPSGLKPLTTGDFDFDSTLDGDGTVPHKLGLLEGITTYYVEGTAHGSLLNNRRVLKAVRDILRNGSTTELSTVKPMIINPRGTKAVPVINYEIEHLETVARQIRNDENPDQAIVYDAEKILLRSLLGGKEDVDDDLSLISLGKKRQPKSAELDMRFVFGDITAIDSPVIIVGQYQNVPPGGAGGAVDRKINNLISRGFENNMLGLDLGQLFTIPLGKSANKLLKESVETVVVVGMGEFGRFNREDLRYLMMNAALGVLGLGYDTFATVLIGASIDAFSVERAIRSIWLGISDAVDRLPDDEKIKKISVILAESHTGRQAHIEKIIKEVKDEIEKTSPKTGKYKFENLEIVLHEKEEGEMFAEVKDRGFRQNLAGMTRLTIERTLEKAETPTSKRERGKFRLSAFTSNAAIPVREITVNDAIIEQLVDELRYSNSVYKQENYGKLLHSILMPEDFQSVIDTDKSLVLVINREASVVPWEMLCFGGTGRTASNFGVDLRISRQFSSVRASVPSAAPAMNKQFKALIIADPAPEPELQLSGARREGVRLKEFFRQMQTNLRDKIDLQFQACIGSEECDIVKILNLIFNEEFDIIHFAGHGTFDADDPSNSGWVFGKNLILSAHEIFRLRRVPRLVFANACFSAGLPTVESNRQLAGLAEAFFDRGIENYIGAGWQVSDEHAIKFAQTFYQSTIENGMTLGEALSDSRIVISPHHTKNVLPSDSTWGAYQHYGNPNTRLVEPLRERRAEARSPRTKTTKK